MSECSHVYEKKTVIPKSCYADGIYQYICMYCDDSYTEMVATTGHDYRKTVVKPTATEQGYTLFECTVCGDSYISDYKDNNPFDGNKPDIPSDSTIPSEPIVPSKPSVPSVSPSVPEIETENDDYIDNEEIYEDVSSASSDEIAEKFIDDKDSISVMYFCVLSVIIIAMIWYKKKNHRSL
ncbi:MAG: hypothetical protein J6A05_02725, partial [Oscillospiraceae bacterium]|nr:hypothetical protein [Oscillospiraceae bacterium]